MRRRVAVFVTTAVLLALPAVAYAESSSVGLRVSGVYRSHRWVNLTSTYASGTASIVLLKEGVEATSQSVAVPGPGALLFRAVPATGTVSTFVAVAHDADGTELARSAPLTIRAARYVPRRPAIRLAQNRVVGRSLRVPGRSGLGTVYISVILRNRIVSRQLVRGSRRFLLRAVRVPYGRSVLRLRASNAWGGVRSTGVRIANIGRTPRAATYIVIDKGYFTLYYVRGRVLKADYPIAIGTPYTPTPTGNFVIRNKERMGGGTAWGVLRMGLSRITRHGLRATSYYVHGTNDPGSIGTEASHGCIRMYNRHVVRLARMVRLRTRVLIRE